MKSNVCLRYAVRALILYELTGGIDEEWEQADELGGSGRVIPPGV